MNKTKSLTPNPDFLRARMRVLFEDEKQNTIGRLGEKSLHKIIKFYLEPDESFHEIKYLGSVADIKNAQGVYEIQTRSTEKLIPKLDKFLSETPVTVVIPLATEKTVRWLDTESGELTEPRKSPRHENEYTVLRELYKIRSFLNNKNLRVKLLYLRVEEYRYLNGWDKERKRGSTRMERIPLELLDEREFCTPRDYASLIPESLSEVFTSKELVKAAKIPQRISSYATAALVHAGVIEKIGKKGNAFLYKRVF